MYFLMKHGYYMADTFLILCILIALRRVFLQMQTRLSMRIVFIFVTNFAAWNIIIAGNDFSLDGSEQNVGKKTVLL